MTPTLVQEAVRGSIRSIQQALIEQQRQYTREELLDLCDACALMAAGSEKLWENAKNLLEQGMERKKLIGRLSHSKVEVDDVVSLLDRTKAIVSSNEPGSETLGGVEVDKLAQHVQTIQANLVALIQWLKTEPPEVDLALLMNPSKSSNYETIDSILGRMKSGGDW